MNSIRKLLASSVLAAGALATGAAGISIATAADDVAATTPPTAGPHGWHHHGGPGHLLSKLNLTDAQKAQVKTIMTGAMPEMKNIHRQMHANSLKLQQTQPNDANFSNVVAEVSQANASLHSQMITQKAEVRASVFKVLTPAQQQQLQTLEAQQQAKRAAWAASHSRGAPAAAE